MRLIVYPFLLGYDYLLLSYLFVNLLCKRNAFSLIICYENSLFTPRKVVKNCDIKLVIIDLMPFQRHDTTRLNLEVLFYSREEPEGGVKVLLIGLVRLQLVREPKDRLIPSSHNCLPCCAHSATLSLSEKKNLFFFAKKERPQSTRSQNQSSTERNGHHQASL